MLRSRCLWCVAAMMVGTVSVAVADDGPTLGVTADLFSKYIWRGQNVIDDWVLQPGVSAGYKGFTGSIWGNVDLTGELVDDWEISEVDYAVDYSNTFPGQETFAYSVGAIYYDFPNTTWDATSEVYGGLSVDVPFSPAVKWFYDFDEADGSYIQFSIGHTIEKIASWTEHDFCGLSLGASVGYATDNYNDFYFGVDDGAINDLTLSAGVPFCFGSLTIKPSIGYSVMIDDDIRDATDKSDNLWCGVGAAYSF
ncbi:MAG: hypothetical protein KBE65_02375 [Phycisphaerae bacterium]|nr:hypothetical protein [Phycisphaerae bacterium]